jgi:uncharacterized protein involved in response to NO
MQDMNGEQVSDAEVQQILEAANWAPTHGKTEPWRFAVLARSTVQREAFDLVLQVHTLEPAPVQSVMVMCAACVYDACYLPWTRARRSQRQTSHLAARS